MDWLKTLKKQLWEKNCIDLIIIDSYADLFTGGMNNSNEVRSFLNLYDDLTKAYGTSIIFITLIKLLLVSSK